MTSVDPFSIEKLFRIDGDVALVTGGGNGLGRIGALALAAAGASVAVTDVDSISAKAVASEICDMGVHAQSFALDVSDRGQINSVVDEVAHALGKLNILLNNAGIARRQPSENISDEDWDTVIEVNMTAPFMCCRAASRHMLAQGEGRIISMASVMGFRGNSLFPHAVYQTSKGALINMTRSLAAEWADRGIRVNAIAPHFFYTNLAAKLRDDRPELVAAIEARTPMGRLGKPEEIAGGIIFLATEASALVTGHTLAIDGGWLAI